MKRTMWEREGPSHYSCKRLRWQGLEGRGRQKYWQERAYGNSARGQRGADSKKWRRGEDVMRYTRMRIAQSSAVVNLFAVYHSNGAGKRWKEEGCGIRRPKILKYAELCCWEADSAPLMRPWPASLLRYRPPTKLEVSPVYEVQRLASLQYRRRPNRWWELLQVWWMRP